MTRTLFVAAILALSGTTATTAGADGLPVEGVDASRSGVVAAPSSDLRYVALRAPRGTVVAAVETSGGQVLASRSLPGRFTIPAVAYDGSAAGLSADGSTLVLIKPRGRFPRRETAFAILDTDPLRVREMVTLRGDFSFDALSPRGTWLYLVQYLSPRDPTQYLVRLYDLRTGELLPEPIIDPREVGDVMRGTPITRAASPDGRWAYTLYDGAGEHPFIHALDTVKRTARCIDLHDLMGYPSLPDLRLDVGPGGGTLTVLDGADEPLAIVDTRSFRVSRPPQADPASPASADEGSPSQWIFVAGAVMLTLAALAGLKRLEKRRRGRGTTQPLEVLGRVGDEIEVELRDPLLNDSPHGFPEVRHEAQEAKRERVLGP
jgi:hypothetical protein